MFESLKKKFSRTSEKLEEELIEEAEEEDNLQEESGSRFSFFSFGRKKEKETEEEDDENLLVGADEEPLEEETEEVREEAEEVKEEKKSRFWSRSKDKDDEAEPQDEEEEDDEDLLVETEEEEAEEDEETEEKKSHFWSRNKDKDSEPEEAEEKKSHFWSRNKDKDKDTEDVSVDGEASGGIFSFVREKTIQEKHVDDILFELEMELLQGDVAMEVATEVVESVKQNLVGKKIKRSDITEYTYYALRDAVEEIIDIPGKSMTEMLEEKKAQGEPLVVMFVGINGTGKTTTIGKLANYYLKMGYTPVIAASDTFRAGAIEQVTYHADNVGVKIIKHQKGSDPAAVAFDAVEHARAQGKELVLIDTAGRMQTNTNLMDEMKKIKRVSKPDLVIFVGDAITGNDATEQARKFNEAIDIDGVILTKADADSKGGASLSIGYVIKKPIMFLGVGQGYDDIMEYDPQWMLNQLFSEDDEVGAEA